MSNAEMIPGRFEKWAVARRRCRWIQGHLAAGRIVLISTYTRSTKLSAKHSDFVQARKSGLYLRSGKNWVCIDGCKLTAVGQ